MRAEDPAAVMRAALDGGLPEVKHPGHRYYVMVPGGQVFTITVMVHVACVSDRLAGHAADLGAGLSPRVQMPCLVVTAGLGT